MSLPPDLIHDASRLRPRRLQALRAAFTRCPEEDLEDALQEADLALVQHPARFREAWESGEAAFFGLLNTISWRAVRGEYRRAGRRYLHTSAPLEMLSDPGPPTWTHCLLREVLELLPAVIEEAIQRHGGTRQAGLRRALWERLLNTPSDTAAARTEQLPREYVNRARRQIEREMAHLAEPPA